MSKRKRQRAGKTTTQRGRRSQTDPKTQGIRPWILPGFLGVAVLAIVLVAASVVINEDQAIADAGAQAPPPVLGEQTAQVTIHEYGDFLCPFCGRFARSVKPEIQERYIDTGLVRLAWHDITGHGQPSRDTANAARCAGDQGRFWDYHDTLYAIQQGAGHADYAPERLKQYGDSLGLDPEAFHACIDDSTYDKAVEASMRDARRNGFTGTPSFRVGEQVIVGAQPFEVFAEAIERELRAQG